MLSKEGKDMNFLFRCFLSISATSWMLAIYFVKVISEDMSLWEFLFCTVLVVVVMILLALCVIKLSGKLQKDSIKTISSVSLADNEFLPVYLGYFFVALSIDNVYTFLFIYLVVFLFVMLTDYYFNPMFLVFGYHFYHVKTSTYTPVFLIYKTSERLINENQLTNLFRINDWTYISYGEEE